MVVGGTERGGIDSVRVGERTVLSALRTDGGIGANIVVCPCSCRRELVGRAGTILESLLVASGLPLVTVQWRRPPGAPRLWSLEVACTLLPDADRVAHMVGAAGVQALDEAHPEQVLDLVVNPRPAQLDVSEGDEGGLSVGMRFASTVPVTLLISVGKLGGRPTVATAATHLPAHERRCATASGREGPGTLLTDTGVKEIDDGTAWATLRLEGALRRLELTPPGAPSPASGSDLFWSGLGAMAIGDGAGCRRVLPLLLSDGRTRWPDGGDAPERALHALLAGGTALMTGEPGAALDVSEALVGGTLTTIRQSATHADWALWKMALTWLSDALLHAAPEALIEELKQEAQLGPGSAGSVALPMAGGAKTRTPGPADLLHLLIGTDTDARSVGEVEAGPPALEAWALLRRGDAEEGYTGWRRALSEGLAGGPSGRGSWDPAGEATRGAPQTGQLLACLGFGLLGLSPDAPSGRIRIAPSLPAHLSAFTARKIRLGHSLIDMEYRRERDRHRYELSPTEGRVPPTVIFAPSIAGDVPRQVFVDGQEVELDRIRVGARWRLHVQLPLDGVRTIEVEGR
ncbi:MAG: hypothetical protein HKO53_09650 [Gemmatimonadetes bacterium]|nr:hypothetical protein [Gemmatimonadota bacterium]